MLYASLFIEKLSSHDSFHSDNTHTARLFVWFLSYFGEYFDIESTAIMFMQESIPVVLPKLYWGMDNSTDKLWVLDPFNNK